MSRSASLDLIPASVSDYRELARRRLPRQVFDYLDGGAFDESTLAANVDDLARVRFRQRVLVDVAERRTAVTVLGTELSMPVVLAPIGFGGMMSRRAEVAAARAAERAGVAFCESTLSICPVEEVAAATTRPPWFQLYVMKDRSVAEALIDRAASAGCETLVLTVDLPVVGHRYRDVRNGVSGGVPWTRSWRRAIDVVRHPRWVRDVALRGRPLSFGNLEGVLRDERVPKDFQRWVASQFDPTVTWDDLAWLRDRWPGKLALKGILD
ncbi:MAG TPA: alpha-hydroxy-acid oxidizing protein, partial [Acidimicrobiales bacterium]|nr:alpha-hydroxy-acid oxidizing protein [Acidimicrobiales bacterium]